MFRGRVLESTHSVFKVEGRTPEDCDKEAAKYFDSVDKDFRNADEGLVLVQVIEPAVAEKVAFVKWNGRQKDRRDWPSYVAFPSNFEVLMR